MMDIEQLQVSVPAVFATEPIKEVSSKYSFIPTTQLLSDLKKLGWHVDRARQQRSKNKEYTKHMLVFRSPQIPSINGTHTELIVINSHDRTASFNFMVGLFKIACCNGLIVADKVFDSLRLRHIGYEFADLEALINVIMENIPSVIGYVTKLQETKLSADQQKEFAIKAIATRFKEYVAEDGTVNVPAIEKAIDVDNFLLPVRDEDDNPTVWSVYNRVQEKLMNGGFRRMGTKDERWKSVRRVTNIKLDMDMNKALWQLANEYVPN